MSARGKRRPALLMFLCWLATGVFIVPANERALVRRLGQLVTTDDTLQDGAITAPPRLYSSGLYVDLPWPLSQVYRVNLQQTRTLTVGTKLAADLSGPLIPEDDQPAAMFLTGDRNLLEVQVIVQYHLAEEHLADYLFEQATPTAALARITETVLADVLARCEVDFVYPQGLGELSRQLTTRVQARTARLQPGVIVDQVTISHVAPPLSVRAYFVDVVNARAEQERTIQVALADGRRRVADSLQEARTLTSAAQSDRENILATAEARADRFRELVTQLQADGLPDSSDTTSYAQRRRWYLQRQYQATMQTLLKTLRGKILLEGQQPADLSILPE